MSHINIVQINSGLGILLTAGFIVDTLGIKPDAEKSAKRAVWWSASDYPIICDKFKAYIDQCKSKNVAALSADRPKKDAASAEPTGQTADLFSNAAAVTTSVDVGDPFADAPAATSAVVDPFA